MEQRSNSIFYSSLRQSSDRHALLPFKRPTFILFLVVVTTICTVSFPHPTLIASPENSFKGERPDVKPLLRVLPAFRKEECDWAVRWDICLKCLASNYRYAQRIHFFPSGQYREHGCYTEERGFFLLVE